MSQNRDPLDDESSDDADLGGDDAGGGPRGGARVSRDEPSQGDPTADLEPDVDPRDLRVATLERELLDMTGRLRAVSKAYSQQQDEMSAFRERMEAQSRMARSRREAEVVRIFFDPVQNLKRAMDAQHADAASFLEGIRLVHHQFVEALSKLGLTAIPGVGAAFDPNIHEALAVMPVADPAQDGVVLFVHSDGFMVDGRAIQVAQVVIGKHAPESAGGDRT